MSILDFFPKVQIHIQLSNLLLQIIMAINSFLKFYQVACHSSHSNTPLACVVFFVDFIIIEKSQWIREVDNTTSKEFSLHAQFNPWVQTVSDWFSEFKTRS